MPGFLRQSTSSQSRTLGPFVDSSDGITPKTGLTIANTDIKLVKNGAASVDKNSGGGTHRVNGVYGVTFDATDSATVGEMEVSVVVSGVLPVFDKFVVLEEVVYDALFAASAPGYVKDVDYTSFSSDSFDINNNINIDGGIICTSPSTFTAITATNVTLSGALVSTHSSNDIRGVRLAAAGVQAIWDALTSALTTTGSIGKYLLDHIVGTLAAGTHNPQSGDTYTRIGAAGAGLTALGDTRVANLDATVSSRLAPAGTLAIVTNLTNAPTSGDLTATMKASVTTAATAATPTAAAVTGAVGSVTAAVNTNANSTETAIKVKTDQLVFTIANQVDSNAMSGGSGYTPDQIADEVETRTIAGVTLVGTTTDLTNKGLAAVAGIVLDALQDDHVTPDTIGKSIADAAVHAINLDSKLPNMVDGSGDINVNTITTTDEVVIGNGLFITGATSFIGPLTVQGQVEFISDVYFDQSVNIGSLISPEITGLITNWLASVADQGVTYADLYKYILAAATGVGDTLPDTFTAKSPDGSVGRIVAPLDADGNRISVTLDPS